MDDILDIIIGGSTTHRIGEDNRLGASSLPSSTSLDRDLHLVQSVNEHAVVPREREKYAKESQTADSFLKDGVLQNEQLLDEEDIETVRILQDEKDHVHESDVEEYRTPEAPESPLYASDDEKSHRMCACVCVCFDSQSNITYVTTCHNSAASCSIREIQAIS